MKSRVVVILGLSFLTVVAITIASSPYYKGWFEEQRAVKSSADSMKEVNIESYLTKMADRQRLGLDAAPNGRPWPSTPDYLKGYEVHHTGGLSFIHVENSSSSDIFLKLYRMEGNTQGVSRHIFIPSRERFTMSQVSPGEYIVRYANLSSGKVFQERSIVIEESKSNLGTKISNATVIVRDSLWPESSAFEVSPAEF